MASRKGKKTTRQPIQTVRGDQVRLLASNAQQGLRGGPGQVATNRRARLVEYAVTSQVVTRADLALLDDEALRDQADSED